MKTPNSKLQTQINYLSAKSERSYNRWVFGAWCLEFTPKELL